MAKISIVVPVYKTEQYLDECIKSILNQTLTDFELILVNDGSPDNCPAMCDEWAKKDDRIKVVHKSNGGLSSAVFEGINNATSDIVGFVDSDDYVKENMFKSLIEDMERTNSDCVCCGLVWGGDPKGAKRDFEENRILEKDEIENEILKPFFDKTCNLVGSWNAPRVTKIYKRKLLLSNNLLENGYKLDIGEDFVLNLRYLYVSQRVSIIANNCNYFCRVNENSLTSLFSKNIISKNRRYIQDLYIIAKEQNRPTDAIKNRSDVIFSMIIWQCIESGARWKDCLSATKECISEINNKNTIIQLTKEFNVIVRFGFYMISKGNIEVGTSIIYIVKKIIDLIGIKNK